MALPAAFRLLLILLLYTAICASAVQPMMASLCTLRRNLAGKQPTRSYLPPEFEIRNYTQTLDNFNNRPESYATFQQRYIVHSGYWGGVNSSSPIFVYLGGESDLMSQVFSAVIDHAARFNALPLHIEHRYYGVSMPFGSQDQAYLNSSTLGYLSSEQALADFARLITDFTKNLSGENCPVVAFGGSYGGMLASWFRLKYPHIVIGALGSSAPILYFDDITPQSAYHAVVTRDFRTCTEIVMPIGYGENETMFQANPFDLDKYTKNWVDAFGIAPRPHWITTEFGGHDIKAVPQHFASNIIFSNGGRDPWSAGGVLEDISDTVVAIIADKGSHCVDLYPPSPDVPDWLVSVREKEATIIESWMAEYHGKNNTVSGH